GDTVVIGACAYACSNTAAVRANRSSSGVSPRVDPRNPMRSARVVSSVMSRMSGSRWPSVGTGRNHVDKRQKDKRHKDKGRKDTRCKDGFVCGVFSLVSFVFCLSSFVFRLLSFVS